MNPHLDALKVVLLASAAKEEYRQRYASHPEFHVRRPTGDDDMPQWLSEIMDNPHIARAERLLRLGMQTGQTTAQEYRLPNGKYQETRVAKVHEPLIKHFLNEKHAKPAAGERPKAVFVIGPAGAGKTSHAYPIAQKIIGGKNNYSLVGSDDIKYRMPSYQGWNSNLFNEESKDVAGEVLKRASAAGHHLIFDSNGADTAKMDKLATSLGKQGYDVHVVHATVPPHISAYKVARRFLKNPFGALGNTRPTGRYLNPEHVYRDIGTKPDETYRTLKKNPYVKSGTSFTTDVPEGQPHKVLDTFDRSKKGSGQLAGASAA